MMKKQIKRLAIKPYTKRFTAIENKINELVDAHNGPAKSGKKTS